MSQLLVKSFLTDMLLTGFNIAHYLLDKGYLPIDSLLDGTFTAHQTSSRHTNYLINRDRAGALFVKQVQVWDQEKIQTLRTEATCYWLANNEVAYAQLNAFLPAYVDFDRQNHILITKAIDGAINLNDFYLQQQTFPTALAAQMAELLTTFHKPISTTAQDAPSLQLFRRQPPAVFLWSESGFPAYGAQRSEAERQMVQLITQNGDYMQKLADVRKKWVVTSLTHGDIKPANFLLSQSPSEQLTPDQAGAYALRLIDWETADIGDPCWDVAAVFQSYLFYWVIHEPRAGQTSSGFTLDAMQPSMRQFWQTYVDRMGWTAEEARTNLLKTVGYCALKLIHTCYESIQQAPVLPMPSARMLQLSLNMLRSPEDAIRSVLSLPY